MTVGDLVAAGEAALAAGRWEEARAAFEAALEQAESAAAHHGSAIARWWLGDNESSVAACTQAYSLFRRSGDVEQAVQCALWLGITYKANFANFAAANGWIGRADRILGSVEHGSLHGFALLVRAYRMADLDRAEELTQRAVEIARATGDVDLELGALSQLGLIQVGQGETTAGFALIDEAMAAALAGERSTLDTVVYTCCDMLTACELTSDIERASQWCRAADEFVETYGCPFLYAECRICYGSVLADKGRWADAEHQLDLGLRLTERSCPALHDRALMRLAALRVRQGRLEDAEQLLAQVGSSPDAAGVVLPTAALLVARGESLAASRLLEQRMPQIEPHRAHVSAALDAYIDASLAAGAIEAATAAGERLSALAAPATSEQLVALADRAHGRIALAHGDEPGAIARFERALTVWSRLDLPYEVARTRLDLARASAVARPDAAIDHLRNALARFEELGAKIDADRTAAELRTLGVVPRIGPKRVGVLTAREQEVLQLLGAGFSNPEIAGRLHISRKTASHHVSSVLGKLNLRNRAEAAAYSAGGRAPNGSQPERR